MHDGVGAGSDLDRGLPAGFQLDPCWGQGRLFLKQTFVMWMKRERNRLSQSMGGMRSRGHGGGGLWNSGVQVRGIQRDVSPPPRVPSLARWLVEGIVKLSWTQGAGTPWHRRGTCPSSGVYCPLYTEGGKWDRIYFSGPVQTMGALVVAAKLAMEIKIRRKGENRPGMETVGTQPICARVQ